ncbi:MAG: hypothetical protein V4819_08255 [Verrucomicrobiota bacterium]
MDTPDEETNDIAAAILQIFTVLNMFGFKAGEDPRLGSFMQMFEEDGASSSDVDKALACLMKRGLLQPNSSPGVRAGGHVLTNDGVAAMREFLDVNPE